jgi:hypothetical protein
MKNGCSLEQDEDNPTIYDKQFLISENTLQNIDTLSDAEDILTLYRPTVHTISENLVLIIL